MAAAKHSLRALAKRHQVLGTEIAAHDAILDELTTQHAPTLRQGFGIGADTAAEMLVVFGDNPERVRSEPAFAKLCGACPIPASSGLSNRHRLSRGVHREAILHQAVSLATLEGLEGLSIGGLAKGLGISKSGLYADFGSKQELQLATIEEADRVFHLEVIDPALAAPEGLPRLISVCDYFFDHLQRQPFPGGCFFAGASRDGHAPARRRSGSAPSSCRSSA